VARMTSNNVNARRPACAPYAAARPSVRRHYSHGRRSRSHSCVHYSASSQRTYRLLQASTHAMLVSARAHTYTRALAPACDRSRAPAFSAAEPSRPSFECGSRPACSLYGCRTRTDVNARNSRRARRRAPPRIDAPTASRRTNECGLDRATHRRVHALAHRSEIAHTSSRLL
jgi:hypothetical protein